MNIIVIGANGQIGREAVKKLKEQGQHTVRAAIRKESQKDYFRDLGVETVMLDLESPLKDITEAIKGNQIVVFTAGSGGSTGADKTLLIDLDGAVKTIEAAESIGAEQFIMVSAYGADQRSTWSEAIKPYYVAKYYADKELLDSSLAFTILRPTGLSNEEGTSNISLDKPSKQIPRQDVAAVIAECAGNPKAYHKSFNLFSGDMPISSLFNQ
ncbi:SDR family oxidoreductase [Bacillus testis]|uniref:SDR family oxidoreductase n=1 Tax=Bacillus testis TaxID=1622072 RepID=UPI00067F6ECF|nr:SDR family oxidoreductase [Bacillus testis]